MSRTPSKLPISSSTSYTLSPSFASDLSSALLASHAIPRIQMTLTHELSATGWTDNVRALALDLLRSGECATFEEVLRRVVEESMAPYVEPKGKRGKENGVGKSVEDGGVRVPERVVREGARAVRKEIEQACELVDG